jgi:hypothetical protein
MKAVGIKLKLSTNSVERPLHFYTEKATRDIKAPGKKAEMRKEYRTISQQCRVLSISVHKTLQTAKTLLLLASP